MQNVIVKVLAARIEEESQLLDQMLAMAPLEAEDWRPDWPTASEQPPFTLSRLAAHLVACYAGLCACFHKLHPEELAHMEQLRQEIASNTQAQIGVSRQLITKCRHSIAEGFALLDDAALGTSITTYFAPQGEPFLQVLLSNWLHIQNHRYQLFLYLKLLGIPVSTQHLYQFR